MAKQIGIFQIQGTLDTATFLKTKDGYLVKKKAIVNGDRLKTDARYARVQENMSEFGRACKAGKLMRASLSTLVTNSKDSKMTSRLVQNILKVQKSDQTSLRGQRELSKGNLQLLEGFNFNITSNLETVLNATWTPNIDRVSGNLTVKSNAFVPASALVYPSKATHYKIVSAGVELDFDNHVYTTDSSDTGILAIDQNSASFNLQNTIPANSTHQLMLVLGVQFYELVNGFYYQQNNGSYNTLAIVKMS